MMRFLIGCFVIFSAVAAKAPAQSPARPDSSLGFQIWRQLIAIKSVSGSPETRIAIAAAASRLRQAGFPASEIHIAGPTPNAQVLVARLRGKGRSSPIVLMAHLDVVDARRSDWTTDPFVPTEKDGWMYGRGSGDDKAGAAMILADLISFKNEGFVPSRDIIAVLTSDEETDSNGIKWAVTEPQSSWLGKPSFALNLDAGGGILMGGREAMLMVQTSEKVYQTYILQVRNRGGHSSQPRPDNAIYSLASALSRLHSFHFPVRLNETTRAFFRKQAEFAPDSQAVDMRAVAASQSDSLAAERLSRITSYNAILRTTCVATRLDGGHADNALPQTATATVNCRVLPGESVDLVDSTLRAVIGDSTVSITRKAVPTASPPSPLNPELFGALQRATGRVWSAIPIVPEMSTGATDGLYARNAGIPTYGVTAIFEDLGEDTAHGKDERVEVRRFFEAQRHLKLLLEDLAR